LKKADIAGEAERLADGTSWMPAIFKVDGPQEAVPEEGTEPDTMEEVNPGVNEPVEALAA
jgi:ParB family transcriptional regulator, chromosome partitioning protein